MTPVATEKQAPLIQQFVCSVAFSKSPQPILAELHVTSHELVFRSLLGTAKDAAMTCIARVPFCCIYGYQAPAGSVRFSEKEELNQEHHQQQESASEQDRQIVVHYLQLTKPDLEATSKLCEVRITFESLEELLFFTRHAVQLGVNPKGGVGQAKDIADTIVKPMFKHSGLLLTEKYTEYAKHAIDIAKNLDLTSIDTLATVSGDGVLHELINGLLSRPDWDDVRQRIQLALISAGSGNAIATSIGTRDRKVATLALIRGHTAKTDVFAMVQSNRPRIYSLLMFTWGMMADSDLESDRYRWLGGLRFEIAGFMRIFRLRRYPGKVYVYPPKDEIGSGVSTMQNTKSSSLPLSPPMQHEYLLQPSHKSKEGSSLSSPPPPPSPWKRLANMPFYTMFLLLRHPYVNETLLFSKSIRMNDGIMWVWYSCETRFWRIVKPFVLDQSNGKMIESGLMEHVKAGALLIEPGVQGVVDDRTTHQIADPELVCSDEAQKVHHVHMRPGYFDVDGEAIFTARTLIEVLPSFLDIVVPEWFDPYSGSSNDGTPSSPKSEMWKQTVLDAAALTSLATSANTNRVLIWTLSL
ncbi:hypothetical protein BGW42_006080, partial [Actinomortierella wolfii]